MGGLLSSVEGIRAGFRVWCFGFWGCLKKSCRVEGFGLGRFRSA